MGLNETANLIYIGDAEEKRLKLRSYAEQLEDLAKKNTKRSERSKRKQLHVCCDHNHEFIRQELPGGGKGKDFATEYCRPVKSTLNGRPIIADGHACVGKHNWTVLKRTPYVLEPLAQECYMLPLLPSGGATLKKAIRCPMAALPSSIWTKMFKSGWALKQAL